MRSTKALLATVVLCVPALAAANTGGFVYATMSAPSCSAPSPCASPELVVYDATTAAVVTRVALPVHTTPKGIAIAPDGSRVYVSNAKSEWDGVTSITEFDASRHVLVGTFSLSPAIAGPLAVRGDGSRVFIAGSDPATSLNEPHGHSLGVFDTATHAFSVADVQLTDQSPDVAAHPSLDRFYVNRGAQGYYSSEILEVDAASLTVFSSRVIYTYILKDLFVSPDGSRLYATGGNTTTPSIGSRIFMLDPATWTSAGEFQAGYADAIADALSRRTAYVKDALHVWPVNLDTLTQGSKLSVPGTVAMGVSADERLLWVSSDTRWSLGGSNALTIIDLASWSISRTLPLTTSPGPLVTTPPGVQSCTYRIDRDSSWPVNGGAGTLRLTTGCGWTATTDASWVHLGATSGTTGGSIGITVDANVMPTPRTATLTIGGQLVTVTQAGGNSAAPFGVLETPADGVTGIVGSLAVTGWALDDVGVTRVRIYRDPVSGEFPGVPIYIGDATMVEGARPDVQAAFSTLPFASRAGWGYLLLTNVLPNGVNGTFRVTAYAEDIEGHQTLLGGRTFTAANASAALPFGAIDTPGQGETVSGTLVNWGWALTPGTATIVDGSMIDVVIDGAVVGHPIYGLYRSDVASLFPGYTNTSGAVGYFTFDTTTLSDGVHTIAWVVRDSLGRVVGIGSRYLTVANQ